MKSLHHSIGNGVVCPGAGVHRPKLLSKRFPQCDSNCPPRSVVMVEGTLNRDTHIWTSARATVSAEPSAIGIALGHLVNQSMHVSM